MIFSALFKSKRIWITTGVFGFLLAVWQADLHPVAPSFLKPEAPSNRKKPEKKILVQDVIMPPPKAATPTSPVERVPAASTKHLKPQAVSTLKGFGSGPSDFGGTFSEGGGQGSALAAGAIEKASIERSARVLRRGPLSFPPEARAKNISGFVTLEILVSPTGDGSQVRVISAEPPGVFEAAAMAAIKDWKFEPALASGQAVASWVTQRIRFELGD